MNSFPDAALEYTYEDGSSVALNFNNGLVGMEWLSGPFKGAKRSGLKYNYRDLGEDRFLVNWHELEGPSFVTLLIDKGAGKVHGSAIIRYDKEEPIELFDEATISKFSRTK